MNFFRNTFFALVCISLLFSCGVKPEGGDTPKDVLKKAGTALESNSKSDFKKCYFWSTPEEEKNLDEMLDLMFKKDEYKAFLDKGEKKFGAQFKEALGFSGMMFAMLSTPFPYSQMAEKGEVKEDGDVAKAVLKIEENGTTTTRSENLVKKEGKWYLKGPDASQDKSRKEFMTKFNTYFDKLQASLDSSEDVAKFKDAVKTAENDLKEKNEAK